MRLPVSLNESDYHLILFNLFSSFVLFLVFTGPWSPIRVDMRITSLYYYHYYYFYISKRIGTVAELNTSKRIGSRVKHKQSLDQQTEKHQGVSANKKSFQHKYSWALSLFYRRTITANQTSGTLYHKTLRWTWNEVIATKIIVTKVLDGGQTTTKQLLWAEDLQCNWIFCPGGSRF